MEKGEAFKNPQLGAYGEKEWGDVRNWTVRTAVAACGKARWKGGDMRGLEEVPSRQGCLLTKDQGPVRADDGECLGSLRCTSTKDMVAVVLGYGKMNAFAILLIGKSIWGKSYGTFSRRNFKEGTREKKKN